MTSFCRKLLIFNAIEFLCYIIPNRSKVADIFTKPRKSAVDHSDVVNDQGKPKQRTPSSY